VVTGKGPFGGVPLSQIPTNLIAYNRTTTGFTLRALDPNGNPITTAIDVYYHAASALTSDEEVRTVTVTTDASGYATISYASPHGGLFPNAVVASGVDPNGGGNIPVSLVVPTKTATTFTVRALNQSGAAIASIPITLSYYAAWAGRIDPGTGWVAANATTAVTTDANGYATVSFAQALPSTPTGIVAVGVAPSGGGSIAAGLIAHNPTATSFRVRVGNQTTGWVASQSVTLAYHAVAAVPNPVDKRSMTPGDSADVGTTTPTLHGVYTKRPAGSGHVDYEVANPATGTVVASGAGATVASGADSPWTVPAGRLAAGSTYRWRARGNDGTAAGPWSAYKYFNTQAASLLGEQRRFGFEGRPLNDRSELKVNVANGNLLLHATDLRIRGTGLDFVLDRYYNSRTTNVSELGKGWTMGVGQTVRLTFASTDHATSDVSYVAPSGFIARFDYDSTESRWRHPPGVDADLTRNATTGEWTLKFQQSEGKLVFSDSTGRELREVDRNNNTISFDYNAQGLLSTVTDTQNRLTTLSYVGGRLDTVTDPTSRTVHYTYTADANLQTVTDTGQNVVTYRYNADVLIDQVTTAGNSITRIDYVDAGGKVTDFSTQYNSGFGNPTSATTSFAYTSGETKVTDPNGNFTTGDPNDGITTYRYDNRDRITKVIDALGHTQDKTYTSMDNVATRTDALQKQASFGWDPNDENLTSVSLPTGAKSQFDYTSTAHPHAVTGATDPQGNTLSYTYTADGNLDLTTQSGITLEDRDYNANGTISKITDGNSNATLFGYDPNGNLTSVDNPAPLGDLTLTPDALSRLHILVDGKGQTTTYTYDPLDRPDVTTFQDASTVDNNYDPDGNLVQVTDATGITVFDYNKMNWQIRKTLPDNTQLRYDYDHNGNLSLFTDPGGIVRERPDISLAVEAAPTLASLQPPDGVLSGVPRLALVGVAGRLTTKRLVEVADLVAVAVVLDAPGGMPPGAPATDAVGQAAEGGGEVGGLVDLGGSGAYTAPPGQLPHDVAVGDSEVAVGLHPGGAPLLRPARLKFGVERAVGLLGGQRPGVLGLGLCASAAAASPRAGRLGAVSLRERLLGLLAAGGGALQHAALVGWGLVQQPAQPVPLSAELAGRAGAHVQARGRVDRQGLATVAGERGGELVVGVGGLPVGQVEFAGRRLGFGSDDGEQTGVALGARQLHVHPVGVLLAGEADQRAPAGQPLRLVAGGRIGQVDDAAPLGGAVEVVGPKGDLAVLLGADRHRPLPRVQGDHSAAGAVGDPQPAQLVAAAHHPIPYMEPAVADGELLGTEASVEGHDLLAAGVEPVDLVAAVGQDHRAPAGLAGLRVLFGVLVGLPPLPHQGEGQLGLGPRGDHPVVLAVGGDRLVDLAVADQLQRVAFPRLVLAAVLGQHAGAKPQPQTPKAAAGVDRRELAVVADQHHLRARLVGVVEQAGELAAADHAGLVHHQHRPRVQHRLDRIMPAARPSLARAGGLVQLDQEPVDGGDLLEPLGLKTRGGDPRGRSTHHPVAVQGEGVAGDAERERLASAGLADHHRHPGAAAAQVANHAGLVLADSGMLRQGLPDRFGRTHRRLFALPLERGGDQPLLDLQQLGG
jgi:YD repeat-containing protein